MNEESMEIQKNMSAPIVASFEDKEGFELIQRMAMMLAKSDLVPQQFRGNIANCVIGLEMAKRLHASPLAVMQNLYIVHGKPGWSAQFVIAAVNSTGKFSPLRFEILDGVCRAWAIEKATGERLESPPVSIEMAKKEGWCDKNGSKWQTMPELMLRYRAATFFGRLYAPEVLMGMATTDELDDIIDISPIEPANIPVAEKTEDKKDALKEKLREKKTSQPKDAPGSPPPPLTIACPNEDGREIDTEKCDDCSERTGCPAWEKYDK